MFGEIFAPLVSCIIDRALLQAVPHSERMLIQCIKVVNFCMVVCTIDLSPQDQRTSGPFPPTWTHPRTSVTAESQTCLQQMLHCCSRCCIASHFQCADTFILGTFGHNYCEFYLVNRINST